MCRINSEQRGILPILLNVLRSNNPGVMRLLVGVV